MKVKTKIAKRIIACVMAVIMTFGVCTVIASAATLQSLIDATEDGGILTLSQNYNESVVINKAITIDLNGYEIKGEAGEIAVVVTADSTIKNGKVISMFADVTSMEMLKNVKSEAFAAIKSTADITLENVCVIGAKTRVPSTTDKYFSAGSAVETVGANADVLLENATLIGRYGVNNAITNNTAGGSVIVEDAAVFGFMGAVKDESKLAIAADSTIVSASDFISDILVEGAFTTEEIDFIKTALSDRCFVCAKNPAVPTPIVSGGYITAQVDVSNDLEAFGFTYKWVPEKAVVDGGTAVDFAVADGEYKAQITADKAEVVYRLWSKMSSDIADYIANFAKFADDSLTELTKFANSFVTSFDKKYNNYVELVSKAYYNFDRVGAEPVPVIGGTFSDIEDFYNIQKAMFDLGGRKMYEVAFALTSDESYTFGLGTYNYFFGSNDLKINDIKDAYDAAGGAEGNYGVLDYVDDYVEEFKALGIDDADNWADAAVWFLTNFADFTALVNDAEVKLGALETVLRSEMAQLAIETAALEKYLSYFEKIKAVVESAKAIIDAIMQDSDANDIFAVFENNEERLAEYVNKLINVAEDADAYVDFVVDGDYVALYSSTENITTCKHSFDASIEENVVLTAATCDAEGLLVIKCANESCGAEYTETIPALGHSYKATVFGATCTAKGYTLYECVRKGCSESYVADEKEMLFHDYDLENISVVDEPTHTENGKGILTCKNCPATKEITLPKLDNEHSYEKKEEPATCIIKGYITYFCECGDEYKIEVSDALGHCFDGTVEIKVQIKTPATCTTDGTKQITCSHEGCDETKEVVIPKTGHNFDNAKTDTFDPTCTETGTKMFYCNDCNGELDGGIIEVTLPAIGHDFTDSKNTADGFLYCARYEKCGAFIRIGEFNENDHYFYGDYHYTDAQCGRACTNPLHASHEAHYDMRDHSYPSVKNATCTSNKVEYGKCTKCGQEGQREIKGTIVPHEYSSNWIMLNDKEHYHKCINCDGDTTTITETHVFGNYIFNNDAKWLEDGTEIGTCTAEGCGAKYTRPAENSSKASRLVKWMFGWSAFLTATFMSFVIWLESIFSVVIK